MLVNRTFDEIRVYEDVAERTGVQFERNDVRRSAAYCSSLTELGRKARASGDGSYYLPTGAWPAGVAQLELRKPWLVVSSLPSSHDARSIEP